MPNRNEVVDSAFESCIFQYKLIYGHYKEKPTIYACFLMVVYSLCVLRLIHSSLTGMLTSEEVSLQFVCVGLMTILIYTIVIYYRKEIISLSKACDILPAIDVPWDIQTSYRNIQNSIKESFEYKYWNIHNTMFYIVGSLMCLRPIFLSFIFGTKIDLVLTGASSNPYVHAFWCIVDAIAVMSTALAILAALNLFSILVFNLKAHYKLIEKAIMEPPRKDTEKFVRQCVIHLDSVIEIFEGVEYIFQRVLFVAYFGMFLCAAVTRAIILTDVDISVVILLLLCTVDENIYLSPYCVIMEGFIEASQDLSFALYKSEWLKYNRKVRRSYYLTMIRLSKDPNISIYYGGPSITLRSYLAVINGTFSFLMSAILIHMF